MRKEKRDLINRCIDNDVSVEEKEEFDSLIEKDINAYEYFKKMEILKNDIKEIGNLREKVYVENIIMEKLRKYRYKRKVSISLGFAFILTFIFLMIFPQINEQNIKRSVMFLKTNHKYTIKDFAINSNISNIELTVYVYDEKLEEKAGNIRVPKDEFIILYESLNNKGEIVIEKIEGGTNKNNYIDVKINYKNYPKRGIIHYLGLSLPYLVLVVVFSLPLIIILKIKKRFIV